MRSCLAGTRVYLQSDVMNLQRLVCLSVLLIGATFWAGTARGADGFVEMKTETEILRGEARYKNGDFAYTETHTCTGRDGHLVAMKTEYRGKNASAEARVPSAEEPPLIATMAHEFIAPGFLPEYRYEDLRLRVVDKLNVDRAAGKITMVRRDGDKEKTGEIKFEEKMIAGQGVYFWAVANLEAILKGEKIRVKFVVPAKMDSYPFVAKLVKSDEAKHIIGVSIDNWFFNLFITKLEFDIDSKTLKLLEYRGTSNVADDKGKYRDVIIKYQAPEFPKAAAHAAN